MHRTLLSCTLCAVLGILSSCTGPDREEQIAANEAYLEKEGIVALKLASPAPALNGSQAADGQTVELHALLSQHTGGLVLFFIPSVNTPNSLRNLREWDRLRPQLNARQIEVFAVCPADVKAVESWFAAEQITLPYLADPAGTLARAYGCLPGSGTTAQRTTVVIAPDATVALFYRGSADLNTVTKSLGLKPE